MDIKFCEFRLIQCQIIYNVLNEKSFAICSYNLYGVYNDGSGDG